MTTTETIDCQKGKDCECTPAPDNVNICTLKLNNLPNGSVITQTLYNLLVYIIYLFT